MDQCDFNSRSYHYATYVEQALEHHIAFTVWDDGGQFRMYDRQNRKWNHLKNIVTNFSATNPTHLHASNIDVSNIGIVAVAEQNIRKRQYCDRSG